MKSLFRYIGRLIRGSDTKDYDCLQVLPQFVKDSQRKPAMKDGRQIHCVVSKLITFNSHFSIKYRDLLFMIWPLNHFVKMGLTLLFFVIHYHNLMSLLIKVFF